VPKHWYVDRFREKAAKTVDKILEHPGSPELSKLLDAAQTALWGKDPTDALSVDAKLAYVADDVKNLKSHSDYLTEQDRNELITRLEAGKGKVVAASNAIEKELADARKSIAAAQATAAGLRSLQKLAEAPVLETVGLNEAQEFREEVQQPAGAVEGQGGGESPVRSQRTTGKAVPGRRIEGVELRWSVAWDVEGAGHLDIEARLEIRL